MGTVHIYYVNHESDEVEWSMPGAWTFQARCRRMWLRKRALLPLTPSPRLFVTMIGHDCALISSKIARTDLIRHGIWPNKLNECKALFKSQFSRTTHTPSPFLRPSS